MKIINNNKKIIFTGYVKDVRPYYAISNVFVFPSYREGLPNVLLQSGSMNIPAIASDIIGNNEIIKHNFNGILIKHKDIVSLKAAMLKVYMDKNYLNKLRKIVEILF